MSRYLTGHPPTAYVVRKYIDGHEAIPFRRYPSADPLDAALAMFARRGSISARIADAYARLARPHGILRQKLTLLLAVLENAPPHYRELTSGSPHGSLVRALLETTWSLASFAGALAAGVLILGPLHFILSLRSAPSPRSTS